MEIRDRVIDRRRVRGSDLQEHPEQYRIHGERQTSHMTAQFATVGQVDAVYVVERDGALVLLDGHLRAAIADDAELRVDVTDLTDKEARLYMLAKAEIGKQAEEDPTRKLEMIEQVPLEELEATGIDEVEVAELRAAEGAYQPNVNPELQLREYSDEDMAEAKRELDEQYQKERALEPIVCPKCGEEFFIAK